MDVLNCIGKYKEAASFLNKEGDIALLETLAKRTENKEYYLPFIGQFSAGKSKMLNRIIGREVLPTKSIETTAFLTYIKYGIEDKAELCYVDGAKESISFEEIKRLDYKNTKESKPIAALNIYLNLDVLKSGLILVDTPGVNTLISDHVKMTTELLDQSQYIVYVMGGAPSASDITMLKKIYGLGIPVIFTRTHIDQMKSEEENIFEALEKEQKQIEAQLNTDILFFPVCNNIESELYNNRSYDMLYDFLTLQISQNVETIYIESLVNRLKLLQFEYEKELIARKQLILDSHSKTADEIQSQITEIHIIQSSVEKELTEKLRVIKDKGQEVYNSMERKSIQLINESVSNYENSLDSENGISVKDKFSSNLSNTMDALTQSVNNCIGDWVNTSISDVKSQFDGIKMEMSNIDLLFDTNFTAEMVAAYEEKENSMLEDFQEKYAQLQDLMQKNEAELASLGLKKEDVTNTLGQYEEFIGKHSQEIEVLQNSYEPQYIKQGGTLGDKMRKVGQVLDVATLLIPVAGWEKLGAMCAAKAAKLAKDGGKLAQLAGSTIGKIGKSAELMAKADTALDATKIIGGGIKALQSGKLGTYSAELVKEMQKKKQGTGFFDLFSVSYWLGKAGDMIDPETFVVDTQYEADYNRMVQQKQSELQSVIQQQIKMKKMMGTIKDAEDELKIRTELEKAEQAKLQDELNKRRAELQKRKSSDIEKATKEQAVTQFRERVRAYSNELLKKVNEQVDLISNSIVSSATDYAESQLTSLKEQLQSIMSQKNNDESALAETVKKIDVILESLKIA